MTGTDFAETWCRMWSGEPELAHELIAPGGRQWSGQTAALDRVVGPDAAADFCRDHHHHQTHHRSARRTLVLDGDRIVYSWDVTSADGTAAYLVDGGVELVVVRDGAVVRRTSIASKRAFAYSGSADHGPDGAPVTATARSELTLTGSCLVRAAGVSPGTR